MLLSFVDTIAHIKSLALQDFDREVTEKQLCYHTRDHIAGVQRRASQIFQVICPYLPPTEDIERLEQLLDLCAATHDLIQIFVPQSDPHTSRRREAGVSEAATIERILELIHQLNQQSPNDIACFAKRDIQIIQEAIAATICDYDPIEQAIFQPALHSHQPISVVARILALADIGALGMEGTVAYNTEGCLLFLEENPDVRSLLETQQLSSLIAHDPLLYENVRQRLLKRAQFQVNLAKSRLNRCPQEFAGFPPGAIPSLIHEVFQYLTPATIREIEKSTPIAENTPLEVLTHFFQFEQRISKTFP
ncbi:hypothetical protein [Pantanalinema sp. GBBB05]|uniref:hypothetical protein n=1 Tax=Pantanalinema sp. GBBB05 TaxID=2604139 RepID=UPI001D2E2200|nr:hypothetical protein [Pantanalinema sp. GBBB05]